MNTTLITSIDKTSAAMGLPPTSLIICSRNRPELLLDSVVSVLNGAVVPNELLIMDQSDDVHPVLSTMERIYGCWVRYIRTDAQGECPARNEGIALAQYRTLVFTDDDVFAADDWFGAIVAALVNAGELAVVTGRVLPTQADSTEGFAPTVKFETEPATYVGRPGEDVLFPMNMAFNRRAIDEVGGFDVRFGAGGPFRGAEDNDMGYRLLEAGYRIVYTPDAIIYHRAWRTAADYLPLRWVYGFCQGAFYAKHLDLHDRYILHRMRRDMIRHTVRLVRYALHRPWRESFADAIYVTGILSGATKWLTTQHKTQ